MPLVPNLSTELMTIWTKLGRPGLTTETATREFTQTVAACFCFGFPAWGIGADPRWGIRLNSTGPASKDCLRCGDIAAVDIVQNAASNNWRLSWQEYGPDHEAFGVGRVPADRIDLPAVVPPAPIPPPPQPPSTNLFNNFSLDLRPFFAKEVWACEMFDQLIRRVREQANLPIFDSSWPAYRAQAWWCYFNETHLRRLPEHDSAQTFADDGGGRWTTLEDTLREQWHVAPPTPQPLPPAPSFLEMVNPIGNFLHPARQYFPPASWVKSEAVLRARFAWLQANGYTIDLAMLEQTHWGVAPGRDPEWTRPDPSTPKVFTGANFAVYGWTHDLDELHRRIEIARREYGLEVVLSLWEQERIQFDVQSAINHTARVVESLDPVVTAFRNSWELDEVLSLSEQHWLNNHIGTCATKPSGPHFASQTVGTDAYFTASERSQILWHQYNSGHDLPRLVLDTRDILTANRRVTVVCDEHSPAVRNGAYTHKESRDRGDACREAGAFGGMNG